MTRGYGGEHAFECIPQRKPAGIALRKFCLAPRHDTSQPLRRPWRTPMGNLIWVIQMPSCSRQSLVLMYSAGCSLSIVRRRRPALGKIRPSHRSLFSRAQADIIKLSFPLFLFSHSTLPNFIVLFSLKRPSIAAVVWKSNQS